MIRNHWQIRECAHTHTQTRTKEARSDERAKERAQEKMMAIVCDCFAFVCRDDDDD